MFDIYGCHWLKYAYQSLHSFHILHNVSSRQLAPRCGDDRTICSQRKSSLINNELHRTHSSCIVVNQQR